MYTFCSLVSSLHTYLSYFLQAFSRGSSSGMLSSFWVIRIPLSLSWWGEISWCFTKFASTGSTRDRQQIRRRLFEVSLRGSSFGVSQKADWFVRPSHASFWVDNFPPAPAAAALLTVSLELFRKKSGALFFLSLTNETTKWWRYRRRKKKRKLGTRLCWHWQANHVCFLLPSTGIMCPDCRSRRRPPFSVLSSSSCCFLKILELEWLSMLKFDTRTS